MTVEERLARLEANQAGQKEWLSSIDGNVERQGHKLTEIGVEVTSLKTSSVAITAKLDRLVKAADMGEGAWWALVKIGAAALLVVSGAAWIVDHVRTWLHG
jgi:uncharacterized coiled-coil protein SlyX